MQLGSCRPPLNWRSLRFGRAHSVEAIDPNGAQAQDGWTVKYTLIFPFLVMFLATAAPPLHAQAVDCSSPKSSAEETECARQELALAEADLKQAFADALHPYSARTEKEVPTLPRSDVREEGKYKAKTRRALIASQEAFIRYRAAACDSVAKMYEGGSITEFAVNSCQAALTRDRSKFLRDYFEAK